MPAEPTNRRHVAVLKGGWSAEREVSLVSGQACAQALRDEGYHVTEVDVDRNVARTLSDLCPHVAYNALHGQWGEDGCIQGLLEVLDIPYTHSGVLASALAMHKVRAKDVFRGAGLPVEESLVVPRVDAAARHPMSPPYVVKPIAQGSSVGVHIVHAGANTTRTVLMEQAAIFGDEVMVERFVPGRELTVAVMGDRPLAVTEITSERSFYDYEAKYAQGGSRHIIPAPVPDEITEACLDYALRAHRAIGCRGVSRTDFRYDDTAGAPGRLVLLEINTQPGMTPTSLVPEQAAYVGLSFRDLVHWIIEDASCSR
jgi:D-alanine-D-alanine ligase